jgi:hypothetical protein
LLNRAPTLHKLSFFSFQAYFSWRFGFKNPSSSLWRL